MKSVKVEDVCTRNSSLALGPSYNIEPPVSVPYMYRKFFESYSYAKGRNILNNWQFLNTSNLDYALEGAIDVFDRICECEENENNIIEAANIIIEKAVPKVRTGAQTKEFVKRRLSRFKTKLHTKFDNNIDTMNDKVGSAVGVIKNNIDKNTSVVTGKLKQNVQKGKEQLKSVGKKEEAVKEANLLLCEAFNKAIACDMVLNNQATINRRYNFDYLVNEANIYDEDDFKDCVTELCSLIDTYRMPFSYKYNACLENIAYTMYKNGINYEMSSLVETVTDYFLMTNEVDNKFIESVSTVLESASFINTTKDVEGIQYLFDKDTSDKFDKTFVLQEKPAMNESSTLVEDSFTEFITKNTKSTKSITLEEYIHEVNMDKNKVDKAINDFKKGVKKTPEKLKDTIRRIYIQAPQDIIDENPKVLSFIRGFVVTVGSTALAGPIAGLIMFMVDQFLKMKVSRKQFEKYINDYKKEIEKVDKKIAKAKTDDAKKKLEDYKEALKKGLDKLKDKEDELYSDEANEKRHEKDYEDDSIDFGDDDDFDFNFDEAVIQDIAEIQAISESMKDFLDSNLQLESTIESNIHSLPGEFIPSIVEFVKLNPGKFDSDMIRELFLEEANSLYDRNMSIQDRYRYEYLRDGVKDLTNFDNSMKEASNCIEESIRYKNMIAGYNSIVEAVNQIAILNEMNIGNTLKLASENLKKTIKNLSDKDKIISREIDATFNSFTKATERAMMAENREAVIKGTMIPSASKIIHRAIALGAAWLVSPAIAIIGALGAFAMSKKIQAKERQLVLDDIEIELKMVDKYIRAAEDNNDTKALKNLYQIQRSLQRQQQRIKYKMSVYHGQTAAIKSGSGNDDYD